MSGRQSIFYPGFFIVGAAIVLLLGLVALSGAESAPALTPEDLQAAMNECDVDITLLKSRGENLAVQLARANREIERLNAEIAKAKPPAAKPPEAKP